MTTVFCIPGMFRSGGAMFAHALREAGVEFGGDEVLRPPVANFNDDGFFEHQMLGEMQEQLLGTLGRSWASSEPLPAHWRHSPSVTGWRRDMQGLLRWEFAPFTAWGWRSPISSLLLPAWRNLAEEAGLSLHCLIPLRNPLDVARSLQRVCGIPQKQGLRLWLYYTLAILDAVEGMPHRFFSYEAFLADPEAGSRALLDFAGMPATDEVRERVRQVIKPALRHGCPATLEELRAAAGNDVVKLYEFCLALAAGTPGLQPPVTLAEYDRLARIFDFGKGDVSPLWLFGSLLQESQEEAIAMKLIPHTQDGGFDETYLLPAGVANANVLAWSLAAGPGCRCRIDSVEVGGVSRAFSCLNPSEKEDGWDLFAPGITPLYGLHGGFLAGMRIRIRGRIGIDRRPVLQFRDR